MKNPFILFISYCLFGTTTFTFSQKISGERKFGDLKTEDFAPKSYEVDTSADAIYLFETGSSHHEVNIYSWFDVVYQVHTRIRLLHKNSFNDLATIKIPLHNWGDRKDEVSKIQASTFNLENGKVVETKLDKNSFYNYKDGNDEVLKFTFPNIKEGSIIEYTYKEVIPYFAYVPSWQFQNIYPKLESTFETAVPEFFEFLTFNQGYLKAGEDNVNYNAEFFNLLNPYGGYPITLSSRTVKHTWKYINIPAIKMEAYITQLADYVQKVSFQFSAVKFENVVPKYFMQSWKQASDDLMKEKNFGLDLTKNNAWLKDEMPNGLNTETDTVSKTKMIYEFVRNTYKSLSQNGVTLSQPLKKTVQDKTGSVADINMVLIAMLRNAGLNANPVLLSTRDHGKAFIQYPVMSKFNYLIAEMEIGNAVYVMDASDPDLGFNKLNKRCYNDFGRVISQDPFVINLSPNALNEQSVSTVFMMNDGKAKISGSSSTLLGDIESANMRDQLQQKDPSDYFSDLKKTYSMDVQFNNAHIDSLHKAGLPVSIDYEFSFNINEDLVYFNPLVSGKIYKTNPFQSAKRFYPVEMPYCPDETYILDMEIPEGYEVDELPKSAKALLNANDGFYEYVIQQSDGHIQLRSRLKLNKASYDQSEYETLRNFYAFVVEKQNEQIVFKKK